MVSVQNQQLAATSGQLTVKLEVDSRGGSYSETVPSHGFPRGQQVGGRNWPQNLPVASCYNHPPAPFFPTEGFA